MKQLGVRNYTLLSMGIKSTGSYNPDKMFFMIEEQLYVSEIDEIDAFLRWVDADVDNRCFGHGNYEARFQEFKFGRNQK